MHAVKTEWATLKAKFPLTGNKTDISIPRINIEEKNFWVEFRDLTGNWNSMLGFEDDYKYMEDYIKQNKKSNDFLVQYMCEKYTKKLSDVAKFRRDQKRVKYTEEEFYKLFEVID
jgi:hypothetical protein